MRVYAYPFMYSFESKLYIYKKWYIDKIGYGHGNGDGKDCVHMVINHTSYITNMNRCNFTLKA